MLIRCVSQDNLGRLETDIIEGKSSTTVEKSYIRTGRIYRPLAIMVRRSLTGGTETVYLLLSEPIPGYPLNISFHASECFEIVDKTIDGEWEVLRNTDNVFIIGLPLALDVEGAIERLLARDATYEKYFRDHSSL